MARHKDMDWTLPEGVRSPTGRNTHSWESIHAALLMDLRDELKELNRTLGCYRVRRMIDAVERLDRRLAKHLPLRPRRKKAKR